MKLILLIEERVLWFAEIFFEVIVNLWVIVLLLVHGFQEIEKFDSFLLLQFVFSVKLVFLEEMLALALIISEVCHLLINNLVAEWLSLEISWVDFSCWSLVIINKLFLIELIEVLKSSIDFHIF
mgnify:CR=1 FL=1